LQKLIHVAKRELKLSDEHYRVVLESLTGKDSTKDMTYQEQRKVLDAFKSKGFVVGAPVRGAEKVKPIKPAVKVPKSVPVPNDPRLKKIWAMWYCLEAHGECKATGTALNKFIQRQTGIEKMEWLKTNDDFEAVIEALKAWMLRKNIRWQRET
jgi:hypothetical protein